MSPEAGSSHVFQDHIDHFLCQPPNSLTSKSTGADTVNKCFSSSRMLDISLHMGYALTHIHRNSPRHSSDAGHSVQIAVLRMVMQLRRSLFKCMQEESKEMVVRIERVSLEPLVIFT